MRLILASDSFVGTQETIAQSVSSGQVFALFVDSLSTTQATTYTLDIRIDFSPTLRRESLSESWQLRSAITSHGG